MKRFLAPLLAACLLAYFSSAMAHAQTDSTVPPLQSQVFGLALTLRACDLRAQDYIESVKSLKTISDQTVVNAEVSRRSRATPKLRRAQAAAYARAAQMLVRLGAPPEVQQWATQTAARFQAPLVYDDDSKKMAKAEPDAALVYAELGELQASNAAADDKRAAVSYWLTLTGGPAAVWSADVGAYTADLRRAAATPGPSRLLVRAALRLLQKAPPGSPSNARGDLSELVPAGGGNLQGLDQVLPESTPHAKISLVYGKLLAVYAAQKLADILDKED